MGACATKPKVLTKDGAAEGAAPAPEVKEEETVVSEVKEVVVVAEQATVQAEGSGGGEQEDIKPRSLTNLLQEGEVKEISGQDESVPPPSEEPKKQDEPEITAEQPAVAASTAEQTAKAEPVAEEKPKSETHDQVVGETKPLLEADIKTETPNEPTTVEKPATPAAAVTEEKK